MRKADFIKKLAASALSFINGITNGNFANGTTGWDANYSSNAAANGILTNTLTSTSSGGPKTSSFSVTAGDKIYAYAKVRTISASCDYLKLRTFLTKWNDYFYLSSMEQNQWYTPSGIITFSESGAINATLYHGYSSEPMGKSIEVDEVIIYNLTANGLSDKDLTWCDANIPANIVW